MPVVRLNWSTVYCFHWQYQRQSTVPACSVREAVSLGAEIVLVSLTLKTGDEAVDARNVEVFARLVEEAAQLGIPVIGEFFPAQRHLDAGRDAGAGHEWGAIIAELGADLIKTFFVNDFAKVAAACPVPILGLGAEKKSQQVEALQLARRRNSRRREGRRLRTQCDPSPRSAGVSGRAVRRSETGPLPARGGCQTWTEGRVAPRSTVVPNHLPL